MLDKSQIRKSQADQILEKIDTQTEIGRNPFKITVEIYENGREHGWALTNGRGRKVAFSEYRNSDEIVIYRGRKDAFDELNGNLPSDELYDKKMFLACGKIEKAARIISNFLK